MIYSSLSKNLQFKFCVIIPSNLEFEILLFSQSQEKLMQDYSKWISTRHLDFYSVSHSYCMMGRVSGHFLIMFQFQIRCKVHLVSATFSLNFTFCKQQILIRVFTSFVGGYDSFLCWPAFGNMAKNNNFCFFGHFHIKIL